MDRTRTVHECLFCPQTFSSAIEKDDHTLEHFAQEVCTECNRNLIRIGNNLYTLHTTETCSRNKQHTDGRVKSESPIQIEVNNEFEMQNERCVSESVFDFVDFHKSEPTGKLATQDPNDFEIKIEFEPSNLHHDEEESLIKIERQSMATDGDDLQDHHGHQTVDIFSVESQSQNELCSDSMTCGNKKSSNTHVECDICGKFFHSNSLQLHKSKKHDYCTVCKTKFSNKLEFAQHKQHCTNARKNAENTKCGICHLKLKTRKTYLAHMRTIHNPLGKPHKCLTCGSQFRDTHNLRAHVCRPEKDQQPRVFIDPKIHIMADGRYRCDICHTSLGSRTSLRMHKIFVHKELGDIICKLCAKVFPTFDELSQHQIECQLKKQKNVWGPSFKTFECDICNTVLKSKDGIRQHMRIVHIKIGKRFKCDQCGLAFYARSDVKMHHKIVHLKIRDFICAECGKSFKQKYHLKNHMYSHAGKLKCLHENCDKYFASPFSRKKHMELHGKTTTAQENRVKCELCGLSFATKFTLRNHHRFMHLNIRDFKCMVCNEAFKSKLALQLHTYRHTGEKPLNCPHPECDRKFRSQSNRDEHFRSHSGEKPFLCTIAECNQRFRFSVDFRRHKLNVHGISSNKSFPCSICGEVLSKNSLLIKHMQKHTGQ